MDPGRSPSGGHSHHRLGFRDRAHRGGDANKRRGRSRLGPESPRGLVLVALSFAAIGVLLGAVLPSARCAGAGGSALVRRPHSGRRRPSPEVLTGAMGTIGDLTVLRQAIEVMQDGWLNLDPGPSGSSWQESRWWPGSWPSAYFAGSDAPSPTGLSALSTSLPDQ